MERVQCRSKVSLLLLHKLRTCRWSQIDLSLCQSQLGYENRIPLNVLSTHEKERGVQQVAPSFTIGE